MPRRTGTDAEKIAAKGALQRIQFVIRNQRFQDDLKLIDAREQPGIAALAERWGLVRIPVLSRDSHVGKLIDRDGLNALIADIPHYIPRAELLRAYLFQLLGTQEFETGPRYRDMLELKVDLSYPIDIIEESVKTEIRRAKMERAQLETASGLGPPQRARWDKTDFQLKVYDLAKEDKTFSEIAGMLRRSVSTVKTALLVVQRKINRVRPIGEPLPALAEDDLPSKKDLPLVGFDPKEHDFSRCPICCKAEFEKDWCPQVQAYLNQDHVSQHDQQLLAEPEDLDD